MQMWIKCENDSLGSIASQGKNCTCVAHSNVKQTRMWVHAHIVMAALPNIGGALCSTPQSLADAHYYSAVQ